MNLKEYGKIYFLFLIGSRTKQWVEQYHSS